MSGLNELLAKALKSIQEDGIEEVPDGFMTIFQMANACKPPRSRASMQRTVATLVEKGAMEIRHFRTRSGQVIRLIPHYRLLPKYREHHAAD